MATSGRRLRVGTDCSGIEAPIWALRSLGVPYEHVFSSEIDRPCARIIKANYAPRILFGDPDGPFPDGDITKRDIRDVPDIDLYVAGFPCQPFSMLGVRKGFEDRRGNVFFACLDVIRQKRPMYYVLENVRGLVSHDDGRTFETIKRHLGALSELGYSFDWKVLNTKDHGLPQNRERVFMVGSRTGAGVAWPEPVPMPPLRDYIDWDDDEPQEARPWFRKVIPVFEGTGVLIVNACGFIVRKTRESFERTKTGRLWSPCLTASADFWVVPLHRPLTAHEMLRLQGFDHPLKGSEHQLRKRAGNSMSVPVVAGILRGMGVQ